MANAVCSIAEIADKLPHLCNEASEIVKKFKREIDKIEELKEDDVVKEDRQTRTELQNTIKYAKEYVSEVENLIQRTKTSVNNGLQCSPDNQPRKEFINAIESHLAEAAEFYDLFSDSCGKAILGACNAKCQCEKDASKANKKKKTAKIVGGTATGAVIVTGVGLSLAAGLLTFGVGTFVGLAATAASATAAGVGVAGVAGAGVAGASGAAATHHYALKYSEKEKAWDELKKSFESLEQIGEDLQRKTKDIQRYLKKIAQKVDEARWSIVHESYKYHTLFEQ